MFYISDEKEKIQIATVERLLKQSYWAKPHEIALLHKTIENSLCFGAYLEENDLQIGIGKADADRFMYKQPI